ncbi:MAG: helix-turn-helix transcriptional regulator, partial [Chloroflexota bacterium]
EEKQISPSQLADQAGFVVEDLEFFELGQTPIQLSILFRMLEVLNCSLLDIIDQTSLIGKWHQNASSIKPFFQLPQDVQSALLHPENQKYLEFIQKLLYASETDLDDLTQTLKSLLSKPV